MAERESLATPPPKKRAKGHSHFNDECVKDFQGIGKSHRGN